MDTSGPNPVFVRHSKTFGPGALGIAYYVTGEPIWSETPRQMNDVWDVLGTMYPEGYTPMAFDDGDNSNDEQQFLTVRPDLVV